MEQSKKVFRYAFFCISILILVIFFIVFTFQLGKQGVLNAFLTAASTAGFFGLLGQMVLMLVQEYYQRKTFKVCYLCRESSFSEEIEKGIKESFSKKVDVEYYTEIIPKGHNEKQEFIDFLENKAKNYDGLIIRPIEITDELFHSVKELVLKKKEVVLVDLNFRKDQVARFPSFNPPLYVGSDFTDGGRLVAQRICDLVDYYGKESTEIIALLGPEELPSSRQRCKSIVWELSKKKNTDISTFVNLKNFDVLHCTNDLNTYFCEIDENLYKDKNLIIFCANDTVASELMKHQLLQVDSGISRYSKICKSIHYIGYDGIKDKGDLYLLDRYSMDYTTIDVLPAIQGETAAEFILESLIKSNTHLKIQELIKPKIATNFHFQDKDKTNSEEQYNLDVRTEDNVKSGEVYTIETVYRA